MFWVFESQGDVVIPARSVTEILAFIPERVILVVEFIQLLGRLPKPLREDPPDVKLPLVESVVFRLNPLRFGVGQ